MQQHSVVVLCDINSSTAIKKSTHSPHYDWFFAAGDESEPEFRVPLQRDQPGFRALFCQIGSRVVVTGRFCDVAKVGKKSFG